MQAESKLEQTSSADKVGVKAEERKVITPREKAKLDPEAAALAAEQRQREKEAALDRYIEAYAAAAVSPEASSDPNLRIKVREQVLGKQVVEAKPVAVQEAVSTAPKHELMSEWTVWYVYTLSHREKVKYGKKNRFNEYILHEVFSFGTIEDFWRMYNHMYTISEIIPNTDYLMFRKGVRPEWEDPRNKKGGKWVVTLPIEEDMEEECDQAWQALLLHMIGGLLPEEELVNGAIFSIRDKHFRISLWGNNNNNIPRLKRIGSKFKELCNLPPKFKFTYQLHEKAIQHQLDNEAFLKLD